MVQHGADPLVVIGVPFAVLRYRDVLHEARVFGELELALRTRGIGQRGVVGEVGEDGCL